MPDKYTTIEDALAGILGLVLGAPSGVYDLPDAKGEGGGGTSIDNGFRPSTILGPGYWLIAQTSSLMHTGGWAPEYNKDAVTFYRWYDLSGATKKIERVTVWVGVTNRDNDQGQKHNTTDPTKTVNGEANPVVTLGNAWERLVAEIPRVAGPGSSFDPNTIEAVREVFGTLTTRTAEMSTVLNTQISQVNAKSDDFQGSAESAWYQRVRVGDHYISDLKTQNTGWDATLKAMSDEAKAFIKALLDAVEAWRKLPPGDGTWLHPYRVIARMFNESRLQYGDSGDGHSNAWNLGTQYSNAAPHYEGQAGNMKAPTVIWTPPDWVGHKPIEAFTLSDWSLLDAHLRKTWANNVINVFKPVLPAAEKLISVFAEARDKLMIKEPDPVSPLPMPNNAALMPNGGNNPFPNWTMENPFANWNMNNPFANWTMDNPFANWGMDNPFGNMGGGAGGGNPFANSGFDDPFGNRILNPFANGPGGGASDLGLGAFANVPGFGAGGGTGLGLDPFANVPGFGAGGGMGLGLDPFANGPGGGGSLGDWANSPGFGGGSNLNLTDPLANGPGYAGGIPGLDQFPGGGAGSTIPQDLGDLTPEQLAQLDKAGLLDTIPLTPEQVDFLSRNGLGVPDGKSPTLGQLSPEQLEALQKAGLLDKVPLTSGQRANLGLPGVGAGGGGGLTELPSWWSNPVPTNPFPTTVDGVDVSPGPGKSGSGMVIGDVTRPGAGSHPSMPGLEVGTGGLSSVPGLSGGSGLVSTGGLGGAGGGAGAGAGGLGTVGAGGPGTPGGNGLDGVNGGTNAAGQAGGGMPMMPYMPGMGGAPGMGGGTQNRDRQRNTWLKEDEKVWGTDPDCGPAVIGRRRKPGQTDEDEYPTIGDERGPSPEERRYRSR
jgi:hypothetical protein